MFALCLYRSAFVTGSPLFVTATARQESAKPVVRVWLHDLRPFDLKKVVTP
jgi:hypothetical protein